MNHVNAIRCNDEYQCSHCGKSWDIHEEAPDCKMTLVSADVYKTVNYFGLSLTVPEDIDYIATNSYGVFTGILVNQKSVMNFGIIVVTVSQK